MQAIYLLLFPLGKNFKKGDRTKLKGLKRGPYFLDLDIDIEIVNRKTESVMGKEVREETFIYDDSILVFQSTYDVGNVLNEELINFKTNINNTLKENILRSFKQRDQEMVEEYSVLLIKKSSGIKEYIDNNKFILARFMRSLDKKIQKEEANNVLASRVSYSKDDMAVIDWDGALLIDSEADFDEQLELIRIGNYQLLKYRILDKQIQKNLQTVRQAIFAKRKLPFTKGIIRSTLQDRLSLLLDFDKIDQSLLLVGDWYSANLYQTIMEEYYIDDWKEIVKNKLDNLESIDATARENLIFNWERFLDIVQIVGWMVLLVGYFLLYFKDAGIWK